jgi:hypothetical protein
MPMKRKLILFLLAATPITSVQAGEEALVGAALHTAVAGKTVYVDTPMGEFPIRYSANGALSGRTELALLNGESTTSDHGRWWVADKQLCIQWRNWMEGRPHCFTMQKIGPKTIRWQGDDGKSGIARVG